MLLLLHRHKIVCPLTETQYPTSSQQALPRAQQDCPVAESLVSSVRLVPAAAVRQCLTAITCTRFVCCTAASAGLQRTLAQTLVGPNQASFFHQLPSHHLAPRLSSTWF
jgi:hypothetical protein